MENRQVTVITVKNQQQKVTFETTAEVWGDLLPEIAERGLLPDSYRVVVKETKNSLESDQAVLPEDDFTLWIRPKKMKSASFRNMKGNFSSVEEAYESAVNALAEASDLQKRAFAKIAECLPHLSVNDVSSDDVDPDIEEARNFFED